MLLLLLSLKSVIACVRIVLKGIVVGDSGWRFVNLSGCYLHSKKNLFGNSATKEIENMYRISIELYKHEWKFGRTRNAVGTRAAGECFHSFFEFSQTFTSVCITR